MSFALALRSAGATVVGHTCRTPGGRSAAEAVLGTPSSPSIPAVVAAAFAPDRAVRSGSQPPDELIVFLLTVPDRELPTVASALAEAVSRHTGAASSWAGSSRADSSSPAPSWAAVHTSGATSVTVLSPCAATGALTLSLHPLQTFSDPLRGAAALRGAAMAVTPGPDPDRAAEARSVGEQLARSVGGRPFLLDEDHRSLYHAAATVASNYLVTLEHVAEHLFQLAGIPEEEALPALLPLVRGAVDNIEAQGTVRSLTGPLSRGDLETLAAHVSALLAKAPESVDLYRVLGTATLGVVRRRGELPDAVIHSMEKIMSGIAESETQPTAAAPATATPESAAPTAAAGAGRPPSDQVSGGLTVATRSIAFSTQGEGDVIDLTDQLNRLLRETGLSAGTLTVFAPGATGAVTTLEFEPGVVHDFKQLFARVIPAQGTYRHNLLLSDGNGHSHVRAGLLGPSLVIPFVEGRLTLGTWQEAVFVCFDTRPRDRKIVVQIMGVTQ